MLIGVRGEFNVILMNFVLYEKIMNCGETICATAMLVCAQCNWHSLWSVFETKQDTDFV